jgi:hypothetical protein
MGQARTNNLDFNRNQKILNNPDYLYDYKSFVGDLYDDPGQKSLYIVKYTVNHDYFDLILGNEFSYFQKYVRKYTSYHISISFIDGNAMFNRMFPSLLRLGNMGYLFYYY